MKLSNKTLLIIFLPLVFLINSGLVFWFLFVPDYIIYPDVSELHFDSDGGTYTLPITTNADYNSWHIEVYNSSWLHVSKNASSINITCSPNDYKSPGSRKNHIYLRCDGKNKRNRVPIDIVQDENDDMIFGKIKDMKIVHNQKRYTDYGDRRNGMLIKVKFNFRHCKDRLRFCAWFYHSDGTKLSSCDYEYRTIDNQVTVQKTMYPSDGYDDTIELFIPYSEFPNESNMYFKLGIFEYDTDEDGNQLEHTRTSPEFNVKYDTGYPTLED